MKSWSSLSRLHGRHCFVLFLLLFVTVTATAGAIPRPEHSKPQFHRDTWLNLNGQWNFAFDFDVVGMEQEVNGIYTYERKLKFNTARLKKYFTAPAALEKSEG